MPAKPKSKDTVSSPNSASGLTSGAVATPVISQEASPQNTLIARPAQDTEFNRFKTMMYSTARDLRVSYGTSTLFNTPPNINLTEVYYPNQEKEQHSVNAKLAGGDAAVAEIIRLKKERQTAKPSKKLTKLLESQTSAGKSLLEQEARESKALFDAAKKSRADANVRKEKRELSEREAKRNKEKVEREFLAVVPDAEKAKMKVVREYDVFFSQLANKERKVLQVRGTLRKSADAACAIYSEKKVMLLCVLSNFKLVDSVISNKIKCALNIICEGFKYLENKKNVSPNFVYFLHSYIDFFGNQWEKIKKDIGFTILNKVYGNDISFFLEFNKSVLSSYNYQASFVESKDKIQSIVRCIIFVENRLHQSDRDFYLRDSRLVALFKDVRDKLRLFLEQCVADIATGVEYDVKTASLFTETQALFELMLDRMKEKLKQGATGMFAATQDSLILDGETALKEMEKHHAPVLAEAISTRQCQS